MNMGLFEFKLPDIGEGVVEGEVVEWMVAVGDTVKEDDPILSVMTDKATVEIPAPCDGTVKSIVGEAGDILPVGGVCIVFEVDGEGNASESEATAPAEPAPAPEAAPAAPEPAPAPVAPPAPAAPAPAAPVAAPVARAPGAKVLASPAVRQRAQRPTLTWSMWQAPAQPGASAMPISTGTSPEVAHHQPRPAAQQRSPRPARKPSRSSGCDERSPTA